MSQHVDVLAYLFIALGVLVLLGGLLAGCVLGLSGGIVGSAEMSPEGAGVAAFLAGLGAFVFLIVAVYAALYLAAGYGLLRRERWGRILGLVAGVLGLLNFPLGTAIGGYALWALTRPEVEDAFA
ncbi:MAG: hypothetical protein R3181_14210 [Rubricoccaceae bacterium]|nr:hypothetical protein [Rubricoccaceae bacterium]